MKIKNISEYRITLAGVKIEAGQIIGISAFGSDFVYSDFEDEFIKYMDNDTIEFLDSENGNIITNMDVISSNFGENLTNQGTNITNIINPDDYYYNYKNISLNFGEEIIVDFVGYLKSINMFAMSGDVEIQIVKPLMNKVYISETNSYEIDADYRLKNPSVKIIAKSEAEINLFMDGSFYHDTKTKEQYLKEIYSKSKFPSTDIMPDNKLLFKVNFRRIMTSNIFRDTISNQIGETYNNNNLLNFNKFEDGAYVRFGDVCKLKTDDDFTINFWFKTLSSLTNRQYIASKRYYFEFFIENNNLKCYIDNTLVTISEIGATNWTMITMTYSSANNTTYFYIGDSLVKTYIRRLTFTTSGRNLYIGCRQNSYFLRSAEIGEFNYYEYHMSRGMIDNLLMNNNPEHQFKDLLDGCTRIEYNAKPDLNLIDVYSSDIIKKEYAIPKNVISTSKGNISSTTGKLTVCKGYIYFSSDNKYTFNSTESEIVFTIDDKEVLVNSLENTYYIEEGYYLFEAVSLNPFHITYAIKGETQIDIPVFSDGVRPSDVTLPNTVFDTFDKNNEVTLPIYDNFFNDVFSISMDIKIKEHYAEIMAQGELWNEYIRIVVDDSKFIVIFRGLYLSTKKLEHDKFQNIYITGDGSNIYLYNNGELVQKARFSDFRITKSPIYFGCASNGSSQKWLEGKFELNNFSITPSYTKPYMIQGR